MKVLVEYFQIGRMIGPVLNAEWDAEPKPIPEAVAKTMAQLKYYCPLNCGEVFYAKDKETHIHRNYIHCTIHCFSITKLLYSEHSNFTGI